MKLNSLSDEEQKESIRVIDDVLWRFAYISMFPAKNGAKGSENESLSNVIN